MAFALQIGAHGPFAGRAPDSIQRDTENGADKNRVIECVHENALESSVSSATQTTNDTRTTAYTRGQVRRPCKPVDSSSAAADSFDESSSLCNRSREVILCQEKRGSQTAGKRPARRRAAGETRPGSCKRNSLAHKARPVSRL